MALKVRKQNDGLVLAAIAAYNLFKREVTSSLTSYPHCDITSTTSGNFTAPTSAPLLVTAATATTLPLVLLSANNAKAIYNLHIADAVAHKAASALLVTTPAATTQGTANTLLNAIKAAYNLHIASATYHFTADATNPISAADASDLGTSETLADAIKAALNAHIQFGFTSPSLQVTPA